MRCVTLIVLLCISTIRCPAQYNPGVDSRIGFIFDLDLSYNTSDKTLTPYVLRKMSFGASFCDREGSFIVFAAIGFKGFKFSLYSPELQPGLTNEISQTYSPIAGNLKDSLIALSVYNYSQKVERFYMYGIYSVYAHVGFVLNKYAIKPSFHAYCGTEIFLLYTPAVRGLDPDNPDYEYIGINHDFYEFKLGANLPFNYRENKNWSISLTAGYKHTHFREMNFDGVDIAEYTTGGIAERFAQNNKFTASLNFMIWTNW